MDNPFSATQRQPLLCLRPEPPADPSSPSGRAAARGAACTAARARRACEFAIARVAEGGHELLHFLAFALRAGHLLVAEDEGLKGFLALLASILKNRHRNITFLSLPRP